MWRHGDNDQYKNIKALSVLLVGGYIAIRLAKMIIIIKQKYDTKKKIKEKQEECKLSKEKLEEFLKEREVRSICFYALTARHRSIKFYNLYVHLVRTYVQHLVST